MIFGGFNQIETIIPLFSFSYFLFEHYQWMCLSYLFKNTGHPSFMVPTVRKADNKFLTFFFFYNGYIVRPANRDWACQTERCHTLSNKTSLQLIGCNSLCTLYSCNQLKRIRQGWPTLYVSMPGKRLSLVCCWGPAAFIFLDGYVVKFFGEGRFALSSKSICMAKLVWFLSLIQ